MARGTRICKICGKEYEYCTTHNINKNFRWQDVACCPEHGAEYFKMIEESRAASAARAKEDNLDEPFEEYKETVDVDEITDDDDDDDLEEYFYFDDMYDDEEAVG